MITLTKTKAAQRSKAAPKCASSAKLLCVDDSRIRRRYWPGPPVQGRIYCVREIYDEDTAPGVLLVGIRGPLNHAGLECGFLLSRFKWVHD